MTNCFGGRLYPILDVGLLASLGVRVESFAWEMREAGVGFLQYRDKVSMPESVLRNTALVRKVLGGNGCRLICNDRADLAVLAEWDGVHVGQGDLRPEDARRVVGNRRLVGVSTHTPEDVAAAELSCADYVAIGPVFSTRTKADAAPVVGLEGVRMARALTAKPLVAIGGITRENARSVIDAGADCVAVISGLLAKGESPSRVARDFLALLR
ncbi:thiamine phosphate synthase [Granulicella sibirica]|nr:thiamine phosphate synthase [Granulicella sibirica]